jgi:hypothetical protein
MNLFIFVIGPYFKIALLVLLIGIVATFGTLLVKNQVDFIYKQRNATKHLDGQSLSVLAKMDGSMFSEGKDPDLAMILALRHLISLELIELDAFPSGNISWTYYLTRLGRYILTEKLDRKLYPENFCEMMRISYWDSYPKGFKKEKNAFKKNYHISWDKSWETFDKVIREIDPNQPKKDARSIYLSYISRESSDIIKRDLIDHWEEEIAKQKKNIILKLIDFLKG